ncbi:unnamed protein product [Amoebophrya sp. A25]|nr:unnamed protein product [Amoebophrya sp. A25]|eukprot:GSA25T00022840001.1
MYDPASVSGFVIVLRRCKTIRSISSALYGSPFFLRKMWVRQVHPGGPPQSCRELCSELHLRQIIGARRVGACEALLQLCSIAWFCHKSRRWRAASLGLSQSLESCKSNSR